MDTTVPDANNTSSDAGGDAQTDAGDDVTTPTVVALGVACESDETCGEGKSCLQSTCTVTCSPDSPCAEGVCLNFSGEFLCAPNCDDMCAVNDALGCVTGTGVYGPQRGCMPDADGDGATDADDNCPDAANPYQRDTDADGQGDVCDAEPRCVAGHTDGMVTVAAIPFDATGFSVPHFSDGPRIPIVGGIKADGTPNTRTLYLDLRTGSFSEGPAFDGAQGVDQAIAPLAGGFVTTTGAAAAGARQVGRFVQLRDTLAFGGSYDRGLFAPVALSFTDSILMLVSRDGESTTLWRTLFYDPARQVLSDVSATSLAIDLRYYAMRDDRQRGYVYTDGRNFEQMGLLQAFQPNLVRNRNIDYPNLVAGSFQPFLTPGAGDSLWGWERSQGTAFIVDLTSNTLTEQPSLNRTPAGSELHYVSLTGGPGFAVIGKTDTGDLFATVHSLVCDPAAAAIDTDADGVADVQDVCPFVGDPDQTDTDLDGVGDACSVDDDGDGVLDADDFIVNGVDTVSLVLDTDNDGLANADDDDDDNDGLADSEDRFPVDTDNDGFTNSVDSDDDNDGYLDSIEISAGTSTVNPLSFPGSGKIAWVEVSNGRSVHTLTLGSATVEDVSVGTDPHFPRWYGGAAMVALDGVPGTTTKWAYTDLTSGIGASYDFGSPLGGVDPVNEAAGTTVVATMKQGDTWDLVVGQVAPDVVVSPQNVGLSASGPPDAHLGVFAFSGGPVGCSTCSLAYSVVNATVKPIWPERSNVDLVRYNGEWLVVAAGTQTPTAAWANLDGEVTEFVPPGVNRVDSAVLVGGGPGHLIVAGQTESGSEVWLYNTLVRRWFKVNASTNTLTDLDWTL